MGNPMTKAMDENMKKSQEFMLKNQKATLERQLMMQNFMRERQMSMQIARARDLLLWWGSFYGVTFLGLTARALKTKSPGFIAPLVPLTFILGYQYDLAYGTKLARMKDEAESILKNEISLLDLPEGVPTIEQIDKAREAFRSK